jgi:hypothetical protein
VPVTARYRFADAAFDVSAPDPDDLLWLAAYLGPDFSPDVWPDAAEVEFDIVLEHDATAHHRLADRRAAEPDTRSPVVLALNQRDLTGTWVRGEDGESWLHEPVRDVYVRIAGQQLTVVGDGSVERGRWMLVRVVRELALDRILNTGGAILHACALTTPQGVVIVSGTEGAGKTSTLLTVLALGAAGYVANDRIAVWVDGDTVVGRGLPTLVGVRDGTFDLLAAAGPRGVRAVERIHDAARTGRPDARRTSSGKVKLTPADIDPVFGEGTVRPGGPVLGLVLPYVPETPANTVDVRPMPATAWTPARMTALECRRAFDRDLGEVFVTDASDEAAARLRSSSLAVKRAVVQRVPAVQVALRPGVPLTSADWTRIVDVLAASRRRSPARAAQRA